MPSRKKIKSRFTGFVVGVLALGGAMSGGSAAQGAPAQSQSRLLGESVTVLVKLGLPNVTSAPQGLSRPSSAAGDCVAKGNVYTYVMVKGGGTLAQGCTSGARPADRLRQITSVKIIDSGWVCQIAGYPSTCEAPTSNTWVYWSFWLWTGSGWAYSNFGATQNGRPTGGVEVWHYGDGKNQSNLRPGFTPDLSTTPPKPPATTAKPKPPASTTPPKPSSTSSSTGGSQTTSKKKTTATSGKKTGSTTRSSATQTANTSSSPTATTSESLAESPPSAVSPETSAISPDQEPSNNSDPSALETSDSDFQEMSAADYATGTIEEDSIGTPWALIGTGIVVVVGSGGLFVYTWYRRRI